jgi:hypothetical protein
MKVTKEMIQAEQQQAKKIPQNKQIAIQQNINPISQDDDLIAKFQQMQNKSEIAEVLRELFKMDQIYAITDLSDNQIAIATRIHMIAEMKDIKIYKTGLEMFCRLKLSKGRKSRKEIIDAVSGYSKPANMLNPKNWFGNQGR